MAQGVAGFIPDAVFPANSTHDSTVSHKRSQAGAECQFDGQFLAITEQSAGLQSQSNDLLDYSQRPRNEIDDRDRFVHFLEV